MCVAICVRGNPVKLFQGQSSLKEHEMSAGRVAVPERTLRAPKCRDRGAFVDDGHGAIFRVGEA
jgi:hypothetical protein